MHKGTKIILTKVQAFNLSTAPIGHVLEGFLERDVVVGDNIDLMIGRGNTSEVTEVIETNKPYQFIIHTSTSVYLALVPNLMF